MKNQFNLSISILFLLLLFSVLIISCNQKKCCNGKHIVVSANCCYLEDNRIGEEVSGFANENEFDVADIAIDVSKTGVTEVNNLYIFSTQIFNTNIGDDDGHSVAGIILLPPNVKVTSKLIQLHKRGSRPSEIESYQCGAKITFCTDTNFAKNYVDTIIIRIELEKSLHSNPCQYKNFSLFVYNQVPDLDMKNNYWQISEKKPCLNIEKK